MHADAILLTVESEPKYAEIARRYLGKDPRVVFHVQEGATFLANLHDRRFDFIFADTWPGKFDRLNEALSLLRSGGLYVIDDLLPQTNWPDGHGAKVSALISELERDRRLIVCKLSWSSGIIVATRR